MANENRIREILQKLDVLRYGHFLFTSGRHGDCYMQCAKLLQHPLYAEEIIKDIAKDFKDDAIVPNVFPLSMLLPNVDAAVGMSTPL